MQRWQESTEFALTDALGTTAEIPLAGYAGGLMRFPSTNTATLLTFYASDIQTGRPTTGSTTGTATFAALKDDSNAAITRTISAGASTMRLPLECFAAGAIKIVADAAVTMVLSRKS